LFFFVKDIFFSLHKFQYQKKDEKESDQTIAIVQYTIQYYIYILVKLRRFLYCSLTDFFLLDARVQWKPVYGLPSGFGKACLTLNSKHIGSGSQSSLHQSM